jgi:predicted phosphoribosyltransferase
MVEYKQTKINKKITKEGRELERRILKYRREREINKEGRMDMESKADY